MVLRYIFLIFALLSLICLTLAVKAKRRNTGYVFITFFLLTCNFICFSLITAKAVGDAKKVLIAYYISHAWLYFGVLWMTYIMSGYKRLRFSLIPSGLICLYQTVIIAANLFGIRNILFSRHIMLGKNWWVAEVAGGGRALGLRIYFILNIVNTALILAVMVIGCIHSVRLFRMRFYIIIAMQVVFFALETVAVMSSWPVWINCIVMNPIGIVGLYLVNYYQDNRLRGWSLLSFANEMSDGFILYNRCDDLVHMNDLMKNTFSEELLRSFEDKKKLDEWVSNTTMVENIEVVPYEHDGSEIYFSIRRPELGENGEDLGSIYILHNSTESILELRAMEKANAELERAAKMKSDFLANMSHEIRTPMNAVIGMAEIALREELPSNVVDYLSQIQSSGKNLLNIINDILDFSKIEAGRMEIVPEKYEPLSEINDVANVLVTRIGDKPLELFVTTDTDIPKELLGDAMRIRQVLINIANNAIKFTREGIIEVKVFCEKLSEGEVKLTFHVVDTGTGIREEDLDKLFVSFQQVDSKRNRSVEGTGLGLAISQRLVEAMGGSIGVKSEYGKGSDFYFSIPQRVLDTEKILVVEDADKKHAYCLDDYTDMVDLFAREMERLKVDGKTITSLDEFVPSGERDFLFFKEPRYDADIKKFLDDNPECTGIILVDYDSTFVPAQPNLRMMRRPETTLNMVGMLNDKDTGRRSSEGAAFEIDFIAPRAKILIVDDNAINITIAEGLLHPLQAKCMSALSGARALELVEENDFDIILMDHMMPEMDGIETTQNIRKGSSKAKNTPIIALTANVMEGVKDMFLNAGMNDFVAKPVDIKDLITKVKRWLPDDKMQPKEGSAADDEAEERIDYKGLDCEGAIKTIGMPALYKKIVEEYYRSGSGKYADIKRAYDAEDWQDYTIKVHALKSSSRQIGAIELGDMAEKHEKAGKGFEFDYIKANYDKLMSTYQAMLDNLSEYFEDEEEPDMGSLPPIDEEELLRILDSLSEACDNLDMDGMEAAKDELKRYSYPQDRGELVTELCQAIDGMDIDGCQELIGKLKG